MPIRITSRKRSKKRSRIHIKRSPKIVLKFPPTQIIQNNTISSNKKFTNNETAQDKLNNYFTKGGLDQRVNVKEQCFI